MADEDRSHNHPEDRTDAGAANAENSEDTELDHGVPAEEYVEQVLEDESPAAAQNADEAAGAEAAVGSEDAQASEASAAAVSADGSADDAAEPTADTDDPALEQTAMDLAQERLEDLQRLTAEYKNFRRRTQENQTAARERAMGDAAKQLFSVLDDLDLAEKHGDLVEGSAFATIADKLRGVAKNLGLEHFGAKGDVFDPQIHEAVFQQPSPDVTEPTVGDVVQVGYRIGDTQLRAAKVVVFAPEQ